MGGGRFLSLVALAIILLGCAAPAHADSINLSFDTSNATLRGSGKYLRYRNVITVDNSNSYGFTLSMYANNPDLVNSSDSNYVINSVSGHNRYLGANQWGYSMTGDSGTFNEIPNSSYNAATLADVTNDAKGVCDRVSYCGIPITFGANIEPKKSASGHYSTTLTYTATSKPAPYVPPAPEPEPYIPPTPPSPEPYVPPTPKWTTNGCKMSISDDGWRRYGSDNCIYEGVAPENFLVYNIEWSGSKWGLIGKNSYYDYSDGSWILGVIWPKGGPIPYVDGELFAPASAYVPRFAQSGHYIRFCKDATSSGCTNSEVETAFKYGELGVWVSLISLGCDRYVTGNVLANSSYDAIRAAKTLAEAFGSPCPK